MFLQIFPCKHLHSLRTKIFKVFIISLFKMMCMHVYLCGSVASSVQVATAVRAGVADSCELPDMGDGNRITSRGAVN